MNEDSGIAERPVYAVADGMGGHDSGEIASGLVIERLRALVAAATGGVVSADAVAEALQQAQLEVAELSASRPHGAGSTVSGVALIESAGEPHWLVFNVGDSRVYRSRNGSLVQWTHDHSLLQQWLDDGRITPEQAAESSRSNEITKAVGSDDSDPDFFLAPVVNGERLLICSDGLHGLVGAEALRASLVMGGTPQTTADSLVERALVAGGTDNVTVVVVDVVSGGALRDPESPSESLASLADVAAVHGRRDHERQRDVEHSAETDDTRYVSRASRRARMHTAADETVLIPHSEFAEPAIPEPVVQQPVVDADLDEDTVVIRREPVVTRSAPAVAACVDVIEHLDDTVFDDTVLVGRFEDDDDTRPIRRGRGERASADRSL
nr:protein phosphatase 2C domain-containing protein [Pseudoclavibacter sp. 13-3]